MTDSEKLKALIDQTEKVRALQKRFFAGEKTVQNEAMKEERKLDIMCSEFKMRETQRHLF